MEEPDTQLTSCSAVVVMFRMSLALEKDQVNSLGQMQFSQVVDSSFS